MRTPFIAANWKMYKTVHEAVAFVKEFRSLVKNVADVEIVLAPPATALYAVAEAARSSNVGVSGQNLHWEREGAFTGEVSAGMLKEAGAEYVIIGHSERRRLFGETLEEREADQTLAVLDRQIKDGLDGLTADQVGALVIAYEPVWAIGTGRNATPAQAGEAHAHIRSRLKQWFGAAAADHCHVIYGGSVKPDNIRDLIALPDVDGTLVGGASLDVRAFSDIVARSRPGTV